MNLKKERFIQPRRSADESVNLTEARLLMKPLQEFHDQPKNNQVKRKFSLRILSYYLLMFFIALVGMEISFRAIYYQKFCVHPLAIYAATDKLLRLISALGKTSIICTESLFKKDKMLGYSMVPGRHKLSLEWKAFPLKLHHNFTLVVGQDGCATTSANPELYKEKPQIWIFGGSYTLGWPLDNQYSYPWLLQNKFKGYYIRNFGVNGYGNIQALIQLKELLKTGSKPVMAIFAYNNFFNERNVAASEIADFDPPGVPNACYPRTCLNAQGNVSIALLPFQDLKGFDPDIFYKEKVTCGIFKEIKELCDLHHIIPSIAVQYAGDEDRVVMYCRSLGFGIADIRVKLDQTNIVYPFDTHPGASAHKQYAEKLREYLEAKLK